MYCKNCGKQIDDNADICIHCGVSTHSNYPPAATPKPREVIVIDKEQKITFICLCIISAISTFLMPALAYVRGFSVPEVFSLIRPWTTSIQVAVLGGVAGAAVCMFMNQKTAATVLYMLYLVFIFYYRFTTDYFTVMPAVNILLLITLLTAAPLFMTKVFADADEQKKRIIMIVLIGCGLALCLIGFVAPKSYSTGVIF